MSVIPSARSLDRTPSLLPPEMMHTLYPLSTAVLRAYPSLVFIVRNNCPSVVMMTDPSVRTPSTSNTKVVI